MEPLDQAVRRRRCCLLIFTRAAARQSPGATPAAAQAHRQFKAIKALAFDAYGTLSTSSPLLRYASSCSQARATSWRKSGGNNCNTAYCAV
jgi:hypothetical protein